MPGSSSAANHRIVFDARQEGSQHESNDRTWRRWTGFCDMIVGHGGDPLLTRLPGGVEQELLVRSFISLCRTARWDPEGRLTGNRAQPVVTNTLHQAVVSNLAEAFRRGFRESPLHIPGSPHLRPTIRSLLLRAFDNIDPPPSR